MPLSIQINGKQLHSYTTMYTIVFYIELHLHILKISQSSFMFKATCKNVAFFDKNVLLFNLIICKNRTIAVILRCGSF